MGAGKPPGASQKRYVERELIAMSRWLIGIGLVLVIAGVLWPWLSRLGLGRLPGDIHIQRDGFHFFFPITTGLLISAVVTLILWILRR